MRHRDKRASALAKLKASRTSTAPAVPSDVVTDRLSVPNDEPAIIASGPRALTDATRRNRANTPFTPAPSGDALYDAFDAQMQAFASEHGLPLHQILVLAETWRKQSTPRPARPAFAPKQSDPVAAPALPNEAPEQWSKRDLNLRETPPAFARRVYAAHFGNGLTRKHLKALDPDLYRALSVWLTRHPEDEIGQLLPKQSDKLDELIDRLSAEYSLEELRRLGYAINSRLRRASEE